MKNRAWFFTVWLEIARSGQLKTFQLPLVWVYKNRRYIRSFVCSPRIRWRVQLYVLSSKVIIRVLGVITDKQATLRIRFISFSNSYLRRLSSCDGKVNLYTYHILLWRYFHICSRNSILDTYVPMQYQI